MKKLECGEIYEKLFSFDSFVTAKPIESEESESETEMVSSLPEYNLPAPRKKTVLEEHTHNEREIAPKKKKEQEEQEVAWAKLAPKQDEEEISTSIVLGKGKKKGNVQFLDLGSWFQNLRSVQKQNQQLGKIHFCGSIK